jgi:hypothetical protein
MKDPNKVAELAQSIQDKSQERDRLLRTLIMWTEVEKRGICADDVKSFTFDESLVTPARMRELRREHRMLFGVQDHEFFRRLAKSYHNKINFKNGESVELYPMLARPD